MRFLVVEDELLIALDIESEIAKAGHECIGVVPSGEAALHLLEAREADVVLLDFNLADGPSGVDTAQTIRRRYDVPVIFITGDPDHPALVQAEMQDDHIHILSKPCVGADILELAGSLGSNGASRNPEPSGVALS